MPALMLLMGKVNWYMPRWLDRVVPHVSIEGAEFFATRDAAAVMPPEPVVAEAVPAAALEDNPTE